MNINIAYQNEKYLFVNVRKALKNLSH